MIPYLKGFGGEYEVVKKNLTDEQIRDLASKVRDSGRFGFGDFSHVVLKDTNLIVGYIGSETAELCIPEGECAETYRIPHKHLRRIFRSV